ncbi:hypothetical protein [Bifidobacterium sp. SO1]|uniref:hypothetical protein n=1 Tax=Bifidobacterium sp. SO1 TaxID=2809029 RepID=UPI001BDCEE69|nr:hypothetical protein [Bifidobacterium sp. SO1]MBT1161249.1 hypothetical protein [Bifidobacterium sp. SO1]
MNITLPLTTALRSEITELDLPKYLGVEAVLVHLATPVMGHHVVFAAGMSLLPNVGFLLCETQWGDDSDDYEQNDDPDGMLTMIVPFSNVTAIQPAHTEIVDTLDDDMQIKEAVWQLDDAWKRLNSVALLHDNNPQEHKLPVPEDVVNRLIRVGGELREALYDCAGKLGIDLDRDVDA